MSTRYFDNVVIADTLTVVGQTSTSETIGTLTITGNILSDTAFATPSALSATGARWFASTVSGGVLMGFGTTHDVALKNRAGTTVFGVVANSTQIDLVAAAAGVRGGPTSTTFYQSNGTTVALQYLASGSMGIGTAIGNNVGLYLNAAPTASSAVATGLRLDFAFTAAANNDVLRGIRILPAAGTPGAFTGLQMMGISIDAFTVAGYTTPANPIGINVGVITGTGAAIATGLSIAAPTGATANVSAWLHSATAAPATAGAVAAGVPIRMYSGAVTIEVTSDAPTHTRPKGSICINTGGTTTATRIYINTDGAGTWTNLTSGA